MRPFSFIKSVGCGVKDCEPCAIKKARASNVYVAVTVSEQKIIERTPGLKRLAKILREAAVKCAKVHQAESKRRVSKFLKEMGI